MLPSVQISACNALVVQTLQMFDKALLVFVILLSRKEIAQKMAWVLPCRSVDKAQVQFRTVFLSSSSRPGYSYSGAPIEVDKVRRKT